jgi:esterase/lipase superfamily enzyme
MGAPGDKPAFDLDIAMHAADNFKARKKQRNAKAKAINEGQYTKAESPQRLAKRVNRLVDAMKGRLAVAAVTPEARSAQALPDKVRAVITQDEVAPDTVTDAIVERVIGATRDFLAIGFFDKGTMASRAVCRIVTNLGGGRRGLGTGFLVTPSLLMTNNHVLGSDADAGRSVAEFNYQLTESGTPLTVERFDLKPAAFFLTDRDLDFTLVAVAPRAASGTALSTFGFCPLIAAEGKILVQDPVNIVQHPKGELKQIVIRNNTLLDLPEKPPLDKYAHYETDTEQGSSGSPVFNDQWEVIALHHSGVPRRNAKNEILDRDGKIWPPNGDPDCIDWISNEGIRTSRLVAFIKAAQVRDHEKGLHAEFIAISGGNLPPPVVAPPVPEVAVAATGSAHKPEASPRPPRPTLAPRPPRPTSAPEIAATASHGTVSLTIPLTVRIKLGSAGVVQSSALVRSIRSVAPKAGASDLQPERYEANIEPAAARGRTVDLLFASTRKPVGGDEATDFTDERSLALAFGATRVRVPESHEIGRIERPWELGLFGWSIYAQAEDPEKHFVIDGIRRLTRDAFIATLNDRPNQALVFVHGYNTTFDDACYRLAQIVWDTHFTGIPIMFSWPSQGKVQAYFYDRDSAIFSRIGFGELLAILLGASKLSAVHILAHSMGNQIVLDVLSSLGQNGTQTTLTEVIFAAPDVDRDVFVGLAPRLQKVARGYTLYASARDKAMVASRQLALQPRAGDVPAMGPIVVPNIDTIDVTAVGEELFGFNHTTFATQRSLIDDVGRIILKGERPPHVRTPQLRGIPEAPESPRFWRYPD